MWPVSLLHDPHHDGSPLYVSDEAPELGATVTVRVRTSAADPVEAVWLRTTYDAEPVFHPTTSTTAGDVVWWEAALPVHNPVTHYRFLLVRGHGDGDGEQYKLCWWYCRAVVSIDGDVTMESGGARTCRFIGRVRFRTVFRMAPSFLHR
jgi:alpha-glucosidase